MKLGPLKVNAAGGITPSFPILVDFSQSHFILLNGDNGTNKSSTIAGLLIALGEITGKKLTPYINNETGTIDVDLPFTGNDRKNYVIRATKSTYKLTYEGDNTALPEPMTLLKRLIGPVGISPMEIKNKPVDDIVKWLAEYSNKNPEEFQKELRKIKDDIKTYEDSRAAANRSAKGIIEYLVSEGVATEKGVLIEKEWTAREKKYATKVDIAKLSAELDVAGKASDGYVRAGEKVKQLEGQEESINAQIAQLQERLVEVQKSLKTGRKFLEDNKGAKTEYDKVKERYDSAAADSVAYSKWQEIKKKKKELDGFQEVSQKADAKAKELEKKKTDLQAEILPDLKGLELYTEDTHVEGGKMVKAGFYRDGKSSVQMSAGEWVKTIIEMYKKNKVKIIVLDNAEQLGSGAMDLLKDLAAKGCYILAAEVNRSKKELEIVYE